MTYHNANPTTMPGDSTPIGKRAAPAGPYSAQQNTDQTGYGDAHSVYGNQGLGGPGMMNTPMIGTGSSMQAQMYPAAPYGMPDGQMVLPATASGYPAGPGMPGQAMAPSGVPEGIYAAYHAPPYIAPGNYPAYMPYPVVPYTPGRTDGPRREVPGLENRRGSYSTNESSPATPFYGSVAQRDSGPRVTVVDRSNYTTPSPQQMTGGGMMNQGIPKTPAVSFNADATLQQMVKENPEIPAAVPAVFTPPQQMKSLEQSLENRIPGNRNVYIRGLHPTTDDELLLKYAERFGKVETSKAIIDTSTGACKGFGFAKFFDVHDSEMCIRGFHGLGYEVGFARESFNSRLKAEGDEASTNLYISNLPKNFDEAALGTVFHTYPILSSKILRDSMGNSRGVGFARFENRDICDEIIRKYNGVQALGDERLIMQVRYADTPAQKELKRVTAERRQFRTNEYNIGAYGTALVGIHPSNFQRSGWSRAQAGSQSYPTRGSSLPGCGTSTTEDHIPDVSGLTVSDHGSVEEKPRTESPTPVVAKGSAASSPSNIKKEAN